MEGRESVAEKTSKQRCQLFKERTTTGRDLYLDIGLHCGVMVLFRMDPSEQLLLLGEKRHTQNTVCVFMCDKKNLLFSSIMLLRYKMEKTFRK